MKTFAIVAATLLASTPFASVTAAVIDPMTYGQTYCLARRTGSNNTVAAERAVMASIDQSRTAVKGPDGVDLDVLLSSHAVELLCPRYLSE